MLWTFKLKASDPAGSAKELGPINNSATKVAVIGNALPPMLGTTNQNAQVDLNTIYTETQKAVKEQPDLYFYPDQYGNPENPRVAMGLE